MDMIEIKKGGKYTVVSSSGDDKPMITEGEYVGYAILGEEGSLVLRITVDGKQKLRLIPVGTISYIEFDEENIVSKNKDDDRGKTTYFN
jgi:ribosome maturation factor RimP